MIFNTPEFKVGALVLLVSGLIGVMSMKVAEGPGFMLSTNDYWFEIDDAGGLVKNSAVKAAGIKVGVIDDIEFVNGKARVKVQLEGRIPITAGGTIEIRSDGILGDKHVEIVAKKGEVTPLPPGSQIMLNGDSIGLGEVIREVGRVTVTLGKVADRLNIATKGSGDTASILGRVVINIERLTKDLADLTSDNRGKITEIVDQVHSLTGTLDDFLNDESDGQFQATWKKVSHAMDRMDVAMASIENITGKVDRGEGTIGRLINDEETVEEINKAVRNVNEFLGGATELAIGVDFHSEYLSNLGEAKSYLNFTIQPGPDRYYVMGIVDDPLGVSRSEHTETIVDGGAASITDQTKVFKNKIKFNALFAKNYYNLTLKGGIFESTGGVGVDYHLLDRDLRLSIEAFDFGDLYLRTYARYSLLRGIYLTVGGDNIVSDENEENFFVGAGLFFTNDDLKVLATKFSF